jgi:hypothetical protein
MSEQSEQIENKKLRTEIVYLTKALRDAFSVLSRFDYDCNTLGDDGDVATFTADISCDLFYHTKNKTDRILSESNKGNTGKDSNK